MPTCQAISVQYPFCARVSHAVYRLPGVHMANGRETNDVRR